MFVVANLGNCATLAVSMAVCKAGANFKQYKLCQYVAEMAGVGRVSV